MLYRSVCLRCSEAETLLYRVYSEHRSGALQEDQ